MKVIIVERSDVLPVAIFLKNFQYGPVLFGSLGVAVTVVPISPLFTAPEIARVGDFYAVNCNCHHVLKFKRNSIKTE